MATRTITTRIALDGEKEFKQQLSNINSELRTQKSEMQLVEAQFKGQANTTEALTEKDRILRKEIEQQQEKVKALAQAVVDSATAYGDADKRTDGYRQSLNKAQRELIEMNRELEDTAKYLDEAKSSADGTASSIDGFGKKVGDTKNPLDDFKGALTNFKDILVGGAIIGGLEAAKDAILDLEESTREYRQIVGTLEVSAKQAGYTAEETAEAYDRLYGVLGDAQSTATTLANLQAIGLKQGDLIALIDQTVGAWGRYGDSIPIDGLAEAINETIKAGQVTGTFADVINWGTKENESFGLTLKENTEFTELSKKELEKLTEQQREQYEAAKKQYEEVEKYNEELQDATTAEDKFNIALQNCQTEAERTDLVMRTLREMGLTEAGEAWRDVNQDIVTANDSQNRMEKAMGRLGEAVAPAANAIRNVAAGAIEYFAEVIDSAITLVQNFLSWWDKFRAADNEVENRRAAMRGYTEYHVVDTTGYASGPSDTSAWADGSHASGLDRVPWDGYTAELHKDEAVLSADEADWWRSMKRGYSVTIDAPQTEGTGQEIRSDSDDRPIQITVQTVLDGKVVGESVTTYQKNKERASGK